MVLKRKRSDSEISSGSSTLSSPLRQSMGMDTNMLSSFSPAIQEITPAHLSSRTRKRYRDNRPSETMIYQNTLSILFSAQSNLHSSPQISQSLPQEPINANPPQQTFLHSFWAIPTRAGSSTSTSSCTSPSSPSIQQSINCDDCATPLISTDGDAMDIDLDVDMYDGSAANHACTNCGRQVCHQCAVSNLGMQRQCLICAGKRRWVGGLGWIDE